MTMKDSKALLLDYLSSVRDPERAASLFADNGAFELPFLRSLGIEPRYRGRREITALLHKLLELYPDFAFAADDIHILIETPEKTFAEYVAHARAAATGRTAHHLFTGYLVAEAGEIRLLRETFNPLESPISDHPATRCTLSDRWRPSSRMAEVAHLSPRQFTRAFRAETRQSPAKAVENLRVESARLMMERGRHSMDEVANETGFADRERMRRATDAGTTTSDCSSQFQICDLTTRFP
jgi:AraC-like DNA-binding protein